ncbi:hypothetical protein amrb99_98330 [Actinomadura sp. RB99]|uniref:hypothetical protein n=1 Tax=Actinomadura sp. RB99 TaxID=2691577 RepID=UPI00168541D3|nr:hypothetical protein [Actinomadura sp. RB99]MBD2900823.1 hypothetical protein [Actinomadura sp. RB99]
MDILWTVYGGSVVTAFASGMTVGALAFSPRLLARYSRPVPPPPSSPPALPTVVYVAASPVPPPIPAPVAEYDGAIYPRQGVPLIMHPAPMSPSGSAAASETPDDPQERP